MPPPVENAKRILDVDCGAGQTLIALNTCPAAMAVGVGCLESLKLGREVAPTVHFVCAKGEALPFRDQSFDFVISRLALFYM